MDDEKIYEMYENITNMILLGFLFLACLIIAVTEVNIHVRALEYGLCIVCIIFMLICHIKSGKLSTVV